MEILAICNSTLPANAYRKVITKWLPRRLELNDSVNYLVNVIGHMTFSEKFEWLQKIVQNRHIDIIIASGQNALLAMALPPQIKKIVVNPLLLPNKIGTRELLNATEFSHKDMICYRYVQRIVRGGYIPVARRTTVQAIFTREVTCDQTYREQYEEFLSKYTSRARSATWWFKDPTCLYNWGYALRMTDKHFTMFFENKSEAEIYYLDKDITSALLEDNVDVRWSLEMSCLKIY